MSVRHQIIRHKHPANQCFFNPHKTCIHNNECLEEPIILAATNHGFIESSPVCPQKDLLLATGLGQKQLKEQ